LKSANQKTDLSFNQLISVNRRVNSWSTECALLCRFNILE